MPPAIKTARTRLEMSGLTMVPIYAIVTPEIIAIIIQNIEFSETDTLRKDISKSGVSPPEGLIYKPKIKSQTEL